MSEASPTAIRIASLSDVGRKRQINQDHCGEFTGAAGERLLVLCDGMGGHQGGEVASQLAVAVIGEVVAAGGNPQEELLRKGITVAHQRLRARAAEDPNLRGMGTTAVTLLYEGGDTVWIAHTGDSRAYRIREGQIEQVTQDHSVVAEQLRRGLITQAEADRLPRNELLSAVGAGADLHVDVARRGLRSGDRYLLCSDGLWNLVSSQEMASIVMKSEPDAAVHQLVDLANQRGANDNVTVQVFALGPAGESTLRDDGDDTPHEMTPTQRRFAEKPSDEGTVVADGLGLEDIWARAHAASSARRNRTIRFVAGAAVLVLIVLIGAIVWLRHATREPELGATSDLSAPDVAAPPAPGDRAP